MESLQRIFTFVFFTTDPVAYDLDLFSLIGLG